MSRGALHLLEERNANWIDQAGRVRLVVPPGLFVYRDAVDGKPESQTPSFSWSPSAVELAEYILSQPPRSLLNNRVSGWFAWVCRVW